MTLDLAASLSDPWCCLIFRCSSSLAIPGITNVIENSDHSVGSKHCPDKHGYSEDVKVACVIGSKRMTKQFSETTLFVICQVLTPSIVQVSTITIFVATRSVANPGITTIGVPCAIITIWEFQEIFFFFGFFTCRWHTNVSGCGGISLHKTLSN